MTFSTAVRFATDLHSELSRTCALVYLIHGHGFRSPLILRARRLAQDETASALENRFIASERGWVRGPKVVLAPRPEVDVFAEATRVAEGVLGDLRRAADTLRRGL
jgi:hypothetical protein